MKPFRLAAFVLTSGLVIATAQGQLLPFFSKPQPQNRPQPPSIPHHEHQAPLMANPPGAPAPKTQTNIILSDILQTHKRITIFAGFTRDILALSTRLEDAAQNTTLLAPSNSAITALPRKPWEDPNEYSAFGTNAYAGQDGSERAGANLRRFAEAHVLPASPWGEGEKVKTLGGREVWWETNGRGEVVVQPGNVKVEAVASRVGNGEVWVLEGVLDYARDS